MKQKKLNKVKQIVKHFESWDSTGCQFIVDVIDIAEICWMGRPRDCSMRCLVVGVHEGMRVR